jgi:EAL domain-containing protein (putative c-di-GMP-specific phosphodiesterase class I)
LKRFPAEVLKIDRSFVRDMLDDHEDLAIVQGVIGLAAAFHREVLAEGVETIAHGVKLIELGCQLAQGYGISRPMPPSAMPDWISSWRPDPLWTNAS